MKQNHLNVSQVKVNFKYTSSPPRRQSLHQYPSKITPVPANHTISGKEINVHKLNKCEFSSSKASQFVINNDQTHKKEGLSVEVVTLKKTNKKIEDGQVHEDANYANIDTHSEEVISKANQINALKEEIRYMRKRVIEAENAEKQLKLQFQIYRANQQTSQKTSNSSISQIAQMKPAVSAQRQSWIHQLSEKQRLIEEYKKQNTSLHSHLFQETRKSAILQKELQQRAEQNKQLVIQTREMYNQIQMRCNDLNVLNQDFLAACESNQSFFNQNIALKEIIGQKDIILAQNEHAVAELKQRCLVFQEKVHHHQAQIEKMAHQVNQLKVHSQSTIKMFENESLVLQDYDKKINNLNQSKQKFERELLLKSNEHNSIKESLQTQNNRLKSDFLILQSSLNTNERIMLSQIEWLRNQLNLQVGKYQTDLRQMQSRQKAQLHQIQKAHFEVLNKKEEEIEILQQQLKKIKEVKESKTKIESETSFSKIQAHPLSTQQLHKHLQLLKGQPEQITPEDYQSIAQENENLKQQLQHFKMAKNHEIQHLREMYQTQMRVNNQEYTHQLSIYMKEVQILMQEMQILKEKKEYCSDVIEEEPEQLQYDDQKIKNDLKLYGEDSSDIYMSPPSNTPIKYQPSNEQQQSNEINPQFMLNEIIDLDSKINNYIVNFNKMRKAESIQDHQNDL